MKRLLARETSDEIAAGTDPYELLADLPAQLVVNLARMAGSPQDQIQLVVSMMPYHDRLALRQVRALTMAAGPNKRRVRLTPVMEDLIQTALEVVTRAATAEAISEALRERLERNSRPVVTAPHLTFELRRPGGAAETVAVEAVVRNAIQDGNGYWDTELELDGLDAGTGVIGQPVLHVKYQNPPPDAHDTRHFHNEHADATG